MSDEQHQRIGTKPPLHKVVSGDYTIVHYDHMAEYINIAKVEEMYKAKYIGEFTVKGKTYGWANTPVSIFWQKEAHPKGSNYFGLYLDHTGKLMITDGQTAAYNTWEGVLNEKTNEILYSAYRYDYQVYGDLMADGGAEYTRSSVHPHIKFRIIEDRIDVVERTGT